MFEKQNQIDALKRIDDTIHKAFVIALSIIPMVYSFIHFLVHKALIWSQNSRESNMLSSGMLHAGFRYAQFTSRSWSPGQNETVNLYKQTGLKKTF